MKKFANKIIHSLALASSLMTMSAAEAKMNFKSFKGVTRVFKKGKEYSSPVLGQAALESGLIYDLRFFSNITSKFKDDGSHDYVNDEGNDFLSRLVCMLFPSPGGALSTQTDGAFNFGKHVNNPKSVAILLNVISDVRAGKDINDKYIQDAKEEILNSFGPEYLKGSLRKNLGKRTILPLLECLINSIKEEDNSIYPKHLTEAVVTAFFDEKFNEREDLDRLIKGLSEDIIEIDQVKKFDVKDSFSTADIESINSKNLQDIDDIFILLECPMFNPLTPYKPGTSLLSNASAESYHRHHQNTPKKNDTFPDCVEMAIRHLFNVLLFNPYTQEFDLQPIEDFVNSGTNERSKLYFSNFKTFYQDDKFQKDFNQANNGNPLMRSAFNTVVADLNEPGDAYKINYKRQTNEIRSGFVNIVLVLQKLFGFEMSKPDGDSYSKRIWLSTALNQIFEKLNPRLAYSFNTLQVQEDENDLSGELFITVSNRLTKEDIFTFTLYSKYQVHTAIRDLNLHRRVNNIFSDLIVEKSIIHEKTTEELLWFLSEPETVSKMVRHPFFKLFGYSLSDNDAKIAELEKIVNLWKSNHEEFKNYKPFVNNLISHILDELSWDDESVLMRVSFPILELSRMDDFKATLRSKVKYLIMAPEYQDCLLEVGENYSALKIIVFNAAATGFQVFTPEQQNALGRLSQLERLFFKSEGMVVPEIGTLTSLKKLYAEKAEVKDLNSLKNMMELEHMCLRDCKVIGEIKIEGNPEIKNIDLKGTEAKAIGLKNLTKLEYLDLIDTKISDQELDLKNLPLLKTVSADKSNIRVIILENLPELIELSLRSEVLESVFLSSLPKLNSLDMGSPVYNVKKESKVKRMYLKNLPQLKNLALGDGRFINLAEVILADLQNLTELNLKGSSIEKLEGLETAPNLLNLDLSHTKNLSEISVSKLNQLTSLNLNNSQIELIKGLEDLNNLKEMNLSETLYIKKLEHFSLFLPMKALEEIDLSGGNFVDAKGILTLSNLNRLNLENTPKLHDISLIGLNKLAYIDLTNSGIHTIEGLESATELTQLWLRGTRNMKKITLSDNTKLRRLIMDGSSVEDIQGLEKLEELQVINISDTPFLASLKDFSLFKNMKDMKFLYLHNAGFTNVKGIEELQYIDTISLFGAKNLSEISLRGLDILMELNLGETGINKIDGLETLVCLQNLFLRNTPHLKEISLLQLKNLKEISLRFSAIEKVEGFDNLEELRDVYLQNTLNLKELRFNKLPNLQKLFLENSAVETLFLSDLDAISHLDLMKLPQLKRVTFSGSFKNLEKISFDENTDIIIEGLDELLVKKKNEYEYVEIVGRPWIEPIDHLNPIN